MGVVKQPATTTAAIEGLLHQGICTQAARQWLDQQPEAGDHVRDQLLAQVYERLEECPSPAIEWQAVRDVLNDDALLAAFLGIGLCLPEGRPGAELLPLVRREGDFGVMAFSAPV